jgi:hypothetical protein
MTNRNINARELQKKEWIKYLKTKDTSFLIGLSKCDNGALTESMIIDVKNELKFRNTFFGRLFTNFKKRIH